MGLNLRKTLVRGRHDGYVYDSRDEMRQQYTSREEDKQDAFVPSVIIDVYLGSDLE